MEYFDLKVGFTCNNDCIHCVITDKKSTKDLTTEELKAIIDKIPKGTVVGFTGGEATIRKDFIELLKYCKDTKRHTALQTNGAMLGNFEFAKEVSMYLDSVLIAIHSHDKNIHESIVRVPGMYEKTIQGFKNITDLKMNVHTQTVISKLNIGRLLETYDFIQEISPGVGMSMTYPHPNGNAWINRDVVVPRYIEIAEVIQSVLKKYSKLMSTEAIPLCYLYPYQDDVFNFDSEILDNSSPRPGLDPANAGSEFFDSEGKTEDYKISQLSDKRKGPKCKECIFNDRCVGVWREYVEIHKDKFDLFPITKVAQHVEEVYEPKTTVSCENTDSLKWGSIIIYSNNGQCMNRCTFCTGSSEIVDDQTRFDACIRDANHFIEQGIKNIEISGGDPGEYDRIVDVVKHLSANGVTRIQLSTHGRTLKDDDLVTELMYAGITEVRIPIYGSTAEIHNKTMQYYDTPGNAFEDTIEGMKNCVKYGIRIVGHTLINQYNKNDMNNILQTYIDIAQDKLKSLYVGITFISELSYNYTSNWYLPLKDLGPYIREIHDNHPQIPVGVDFVILDIPYCVLGKYSDIIENKFEGFPDLGLHKVEKENQSEQSDGIPHYRIKSYFDECKTCVLQKQCGAIPLNEIKMFGTYGLKGLKE